MEQTEILIYKFIRILKEYKNKFLKLQTETYKKSDKLINISLIFEHEGIDPYEVVCITMNFGQNLVSCYYFDNEHTLFRNIRFENFDYCMEKLTDFLQNYYNKYEKFHLDDDFDNVPIINIDNWIAYFCEHLEKNSHLIGKFAEQVFNNDIFIKYKPIYENKIGYLINANKFDLI